VEPPQARPKDRPRGGTGTENDIRVVVDRAQEEMIFIGPDHPYYPLLAGLVSAVAGAWQQGYDHRRAGGRDNNPYRWDSGRG
jgi:hypothetical protein